MAGTRLYPESRVPRARTMMADAVAVTVVAAFLLVAAAVHGTVSSLVTLGEGVEQSGQMIARGFEDAARSAAQAPVVGRPIARALRSAAAKPASQVAQAGRQGQRDVRRLALVLAFATGGMPAGLVLAVYLPARGRQVRRLTSSARVLPSGPGGWEQLAADQELRRLIATRATMSLPYETLLRHTADPMNDLRVGRYDALIAAAYDDAGLHAPAPPDRVTRSAAGP